MEKLHVAAHPSGSRVKWVRPAEYELEWEAECVRRRKQAESIRNSDSSQKARGSQGKDPVTLIWDGFQWIARAKEGASELSDATMISATRKLRRLYVGNLPTHLGLTLKELQDSIRSEMVRRGYISEEDPHPVSCAWFSKEKGHFGFVEMTSIELATKAMDLNGMLILDVPIKFSRPNDYMMGPVPSKGDRAEHFGEALARRLISAGMTSLEQTRLLVLKNVVRESDGLSRSEYLSILDDVVATAQKSGRVIGAVIVPTEVAKIGGVADSGDVYLYFATNYEAQNFALALRKLLYFDRELIYNLVPEAIWNYRLSCYPLTLRREFSIDDY